MDEARKQWEKLGEVPVNDNEEIDQDFLHFKKGTYIYDIWHWFEETYDVPVHDLMFPNK